MSESWGRFLDAATAHQDYGWFCALLGWTAVGLGVFLQRPAWRQNSALFVWLGLSVIAGCA